MSESEDRPRDGGLVARSVEEFVAQLRGFTDRATRLAAGAVPSGFSLPRLPSPPGAMSAAQVRSIASSVRAQRQLVEGLMGQLQAFDEQLAVFERILEPLVEWSGTWARLEESLADVLRRSPADRPPGGQEPPPAQSS
ncbi:hypothetical protein ACI79J_10260 [Geodermatophilus sp. SYSU D01062]